MLLGNRKAQRSDISTRIQFGGGRSNERFNGSVQSDVITILAAVFGLLEKGDTLMNTLDSVQLR